MKHQLENITSAQWLNIVNSEADPDAKAYNLKHYRIGDGIMSVLISGVGRIQTPLYRTNETMTPEALEALLEQNVKDIEKEHEIQMKKYGFSVTNTVHQNNNPNAMRSPFSPF